MADVLARVIGLGIAGIDPLGAALLVSAITAGARRTKVFAFAVSVFITSVLAGTLLTLLGNRLFEGSDDVLPSSSSSVWAYLELGAAALIAVWLIRSLRPASEPEAKPQTGIGRSTIAMVLAGAAFTATSVLDPTFLATAAVVGPSDNIITTLLSFTAWTLISQIMLFALVVAFNFGAHQRAIDATQRWWNQNKKVLTALLKAAGIFAVLALLVDAGWFLATDQYLYD